MNPLYMPDDRLSRIKAISFDGDMTLWDFHKVMRSALGHALEELQRREPEAAAALTIERMIDIRQAVAAELKGRVTNLEEIRFQAFRRTLESIGAADDCLASELNALYLRRRFEDIELYPDVLPLLTRLRPRYRLGLISNGNSYPERCGLRDIFSFVVFSQDIGAEKPDPAPFHAACRQAGCRPDELLHIGDSLETDIAGARGVGAISVWLNREEQPITGCVEPDFTITMLAELVDILFPERGLPIRA